LQDGKSRHANNTLRDSDSDGIVRVNDATEQLDKGVENATEDQTMGFYNQEDIPFYYDLAANFAVNDRYLASVLGPTFPNRAYLVAASAGPHFLPLTVFLFRQFSATQRQKEHPGHRRCRACHSWIRISVWAV
jgi:hypothetical protein